MNIKKLDVDKVARAIEADAGHALEDLRESLAQAKRGEHAGVHTSQMIAEYKAARGRPVGTVKDDSKQAVTVRYSPDVLAAFRATGAGWQARMNDALKDWLRNHSPV